MPAVAPPRKETTPPDRPDAGHGNGLGWDSQVVLYNDEVHTFDYVIAALCAVFGHGAQLAGQIAMEAHTKGRAIAEVEEREKAEAHAAILKAGGLRATVESIG